jgi:hypothetical protein
MPEKVILALGKVLQSATRLAPKLLLDVWHQYQHEKQSTGRRGPGPTISELTAKFYERQVKEKRSKRTLIDDRLRLRKFKESLGEKAAKKCNSSDIVSYLESIPPGTNRRSHYKTLKKFWRWAYQLGYIDVEPMARMRPLDAWGANVEFLSVQTLKPGTGRNWFDPLAQDGTKKAEPSGGHKQMTQPLGELRSLAVGVSRRDAFLELIDIIANQLTVTVAVLPKASLR